MASITRRSARAIVIDDRSRLVLIKRTRPGRQVYWTTPGGGVEPGDATIEAALRRELREELGATTGPCRQVFLISTPTDDGIAVQHIFVTRLLHLDPADRSGPEFDDPANGRYDVDAIDLTDSLLSDIDVKPVVLKEFILMNREALLDAVATA